MCCKPSDVGCTGRKRTGIGGGHKGPKTVSPQKPKYTDWNGDLTSLHGHVKNIKNGDAKKERVCERGGIVFFNRSAAPSPSSRCLAPQIPAQAALAKQRAANNALVKSKDSKKWGLEEAAPGGLTPNQFAKLLKDTAEREKKTRVRIKQIEATLPLEMDPEKKAALKKALAALKATLTAPSKPSNAGGRKLV